MELHSEILHRFDLDENFISFWTLYDYVHSLSLTYKKIVYKVKTANNDSSKAKRIQVASNILDAHVFSFDFIYIDEISFNLEMRPSKGWGVVGASLNAMKPAKSLNYSAIVAMDLNGILGIQIIKGGVKSAEFISFMFSICEAEAIRIAKKKVIFFLDNASIHRSKLYMQPFVKYYNVLYNAPYTPQFNPIEFSFSKLKYLVKKAKPTSEKDLVKKILEASHQISEKDCAKFILHSLKFLDKAMNKEDFY